MGEDKRKQTPECFRNGVLFIEGLNYSGVRDWLIQELKDESHRLAGNSDDQPVQAIINHAQCLSGESLGKLNVGLCTIVDSWREGESFELPFLRYLFSLIGELRVTVVKKRLLEINYKTLSDEYRCIVLRAVASLSEKSESKFWESIARDCPCFGGMAFQVLWRIHPEAAIDILPILDWRVEHVRNTVPYILKEGLLKKG
ncbi:MAG: hypothetical protein WCW14_00010 [Candidatus Paceibacterota bacterium]|jgi:hypothetical protein